MYKEEILSEQGAARLQAMADLHELGSGFDVANRDLEIRGAGSLLGTEQSGMVCHCAIACFMLFLVLPQCMAKYDFLSIITK